jgi:HPt (histidine-containing phosphotransfer) domain-containing protein
MSGAGQLQDRLAAMRPRFVGSLREHLVVIDASVKMMANPRTCEAGLENIRVIAHRLSGVAATLGYGELGDSARNAEAEIDRAMANREVAPASPAVTGAIGALRAQMTRIMAQPA